VLSKLQVSLETIILFSFAMLILVGIIYFFITLNNSNLQYSTTPFVLSSLEFYNFQTMGSTCSFDFMFQTNSYLPYPDYELSFILNNGQKIVPEYNDYSETITPVSSLGYQYTFTLSGIPNYNGSVCSVMGQQSVNHAYVKYVSYKNINGKTIVQPVSTNYVFKINSASTIPIQLYNNNTVFITGSVIPYSGYVYINYQNGTAVSGSPFTLGEYVYLQTGNYTLSYSNESYPVAFQYWSSNGGVVIQSIFNTTTNMVVVNNGEIYLNLRNLLQPSQTFIIYSNKTYSTIPGKFNITADFSKNGYYTYYVNNKPYKECTNIAQTSCIMSFSSAGSYIIGASFKNSTVLAEATPIKVYVFNPLSATLSSNKTVAQNKTNVLLTVSTNGGLQPFTYSFYVNNAPIQNCIDISIPTCTYKISNPPNDYIYNYTFTANVSDAGGELVTTNNVVVEGVTGIPLVLYNKLSSPLSSPVDAIISINLTKNPIFKYSGSSTNIYIFNSSGTILNSYIFNYSDNKVYLWVNIPNQIPAYGTYNVYIGLSNQNTFTSPKYKIGEAYQLIPSGSSGISDNIGSVLLPGLIWQIYENTTVSGHNSGIFIPVFENSSLSYATSFSTEGWKFHSVTNYRTTSINGAYGPFEGGTNMYNIFNYSINSSQIYECENYGIGYPFPSSFFSGDGCSAYPTWFIKAIGYVSYNYPYTLTINGDDGINVFLSQNANLSENILAQGNYYSFGSGNDTWGESPTSYISNNLLGDYSLELLYYSNGNGGETTALGSNQNVNYYHPNYEPNGYILNDSI